MGEFLRRREQGFRLRNLSLFALILALPLSAQSADPPQPSLSASDRAFVSQANPNFAIANVELIDGSGGPARREMTVLVSNGRISAVGPSATMRLRGDVTIIDGSGKTLLPGFVMLHEHFFYPDSRGDFFGDPEAFSRLYLAGGATTIRTGGSIDAYADLAVARAIAAGSQVGPDVDVTGPYIDGAPASIGRMARVRTAADAGELVDYWAGQGATSWKLYELATPVQARAAIAAAHARGQRVTGHICATSYAEAADAGIDNIEHGIQAASDFVPNRTPGVCPPWPARIAAMNALDPAGPEIGRLLERLIARRVALTATLGIVETFARGGGVPDPAGLDLLMPSLRDFQARVIPQVRGSPFGDAMAANMRLEQAVERRFVAMGGLLLSGSDPTGVGGVVPGFSARREFSLLVAGGFSIPQAVRIMTLNGATFLRREAEVGSIAVGKRADLVLLDGSLTSDAAAIANLRTVFKAGIGYDSGRIIAAYRGRIGAL